MRHFFPKVISYNHFVELEKEIAIPLALFIKKGTFRQMFHGMVLRIQITSDM